MNNQARISRAPSFNGLLKSITVKLANLDDGDLILVSDLIDDTEEFKTFFEGHTDQLAVVDRILDKLTAVFTGKAEKDTAHGIADAFESLSSFWNQETAGADVVESHRPSALIPPDSEPLHIFLAEASERLVEAQDLILSLETDTANPELINTLFRIFHTIKGECGFLRIAALGDLAHHLETLLDKLRNHEIAVSAAVIDILLAGIDKAHEFLEALKRHDSATFEKVETAGLKIKIAMIVSAAKPSEHRPNLPPGDTPPGGQVHNSPPRDNHVSHGHAADSPSQQEQHRSGQRQHGHGPHNQGRDSPGSDELDQSGRQPLRKAERGDPIIKVRASQINHLVDTIGELLIAESLLDDRNSNAVHMKKITKSLQFAAMQLRTDRVQNLFLKMKRVARDLSKELNKTIDVVIEGAELAIDRNLIENLEEPLMHLVRNAIHHGIESPELRKARGKPQTGTINIQAERRGNHVAITVADDGGGLHQEKILAKAIKMGVVSAEAAKKLGANDIHNLIFAQGLSTADTVNLISGRGVGMDIVRSVVADSRGHVEIETAIDQYTRIHLVFPLITAVIDGMTVRSGGTYYIVPVASVIESLRIVPGQVEKIKGSVDVVRLRGDLIPVIDLQELADPGEPRGSAHPTGDGSSHEARLPGGAGEKNIAVIIENHEKEKFALLVDEVVAKREVVIKSMGSKFSGLRFISAASILQNGKIGFVLDVENLIEFSGSRRLRAVGA